MKDVRELSRREKKARKLQCILIGVGIAIFVGLCALFNYIIMPTIGFTQNFLFILLTAAVISSAIVWLVWSIVEGESDWCWSLLGHSAVAALTLLSLLVGIIVSASPFHTIPMRNRIEVETITEEELVAMLPDYKSETAYAWADSSTAAKLAARKTGELTENTSLFTVKLSVDGEQYNPVYTSIVDGNLSKVVPLDYSGFFAYRKGKSIPGYVVVDPVSQKAEYVQTKYNYSAGAYFSHDADRAIWKTDKTAFYGATSFQILNGRPVWVREVLEPSCTSWLHKEVVGVAVLDAESGKVTRYALADAPKGLVVYNGYTFSEMYDFWGKTVNGYWNFSNVGETKVTDDFGYVAIDGDMWYYTGITSVTMNGGDESNIGVLLFNSRTGKALYCQVGGAEEYSAMSAAQGVVQNYGYEACFPSLANVDGELTYVMALKDKNGIVKQYAMVKYDAYTNVAVGDTIDECATKYSKIIGGNISTAAATDGPQTITVAEAKFISVGGDTITYLRAEDGTWYKKVFSESDLYIQAGDSVTASLKEVTK